MAPGTDAFEEAYHSGVPAEQAAERLRPRTLAPLAPEGFALGGCVLTPADRIDPGFVTVADGAIADVGGTRPSSVPVVDTGGVILPGLLDLHGHPEFNVFAPWEPPTRFANRYEWRASDIYRRLIREPQNHLLEVLPQGTEGRYAEIRALVGGVTAIQGASGRNLTESQSLVRHVDLAVFGAHRARAMIDLPADDSPGVERLAASLADIQAGSVDAFYLHLAEGRSDDEASAGEFDRLVALGALTASTVVIHGTALGRDQLGQLADAGAKLVWSPQSNLRLYGETTRAADALDVGLAVALGADWLPSGSLSLLAELKVARRVLARQGRPVSSAELVAMVTSGAAAVAGLGEHLGTLAPGRAADVVVLERHHDDPWLNVVEAEPAWVELVGIGGNVAYGRADWIATLGADGGQGIERVLAWGKEMALDTSEAPGSPSVALPTLAQLRASLVDEYPQTGPIFA